MLIVLVETIIKMDIEVLIWNDIKKVYSFTETSSLEQLRVAEFSGE